MDLFEMLKGENVKLLKLLSRLEDTTTGDVVERERFLDAVSAQVESVTRTEQEVLHPLLRIHPETQDAVSVSEEEIEEVHRALEELQGVPSTDRRFQYFAEGLHGQIQRHIEHVERELFTAAGRLISGEQVELLAERLRGTHEQEEPAREERRS